MRGKEWHMKRTGQIAAAWLAAAWLSGCGPDTLTAATSNAASAAAAARQAQEEKAMADQKIQAMQQALQQHDRNLSEQADHGAQ
jgi:hypothetical protein